jgi:putative glycosyltransferase (TIGR04348 family)
MRILLVTPAPAGSRLGNRVTALRWQRILRGLGHRVTLAETYGGQDADVLVALHARRSHPAVSAFQRRFPERPILVALTGTDLYEDLPESRAALASIAFAFRLIALHPLAARRLPRRHRSKLRVIRQAFAPAPVRSSRKPAGRTFQVAVVGHLRHVKDPLRTALAVRSLPGASRIRVIQAGGALQPHWAERARREMLRNPRYRWRGSLTAAATARLMAHSDVLVLSSRSEGGANVISEAIGLGLPVAASRIPGNVGLLGADYAGYFPVGNTKALRRLLLRLERDPHFFTRLRSSLRRLVPIFEPAREYDAWHSLLNECAQAL